MPREDVPDAPPVTLTAAAPVESASAPVTEAPPEASPPERQVEPVGAAKAQAKDLSRAAREAKKEAAAKAISAGELALQEGPDRWLPAEAMPESLAAVDTPPEAAAEPPLEGEILPPRSGPDAGSPSRREDDAIEDAVEDDEPKKPGSDR